MTEESVIVIYIRALENLARRIDMIRSSISLQQQEQHLDSFIKQDLVNFESEVNSTIRRWKEGGRLAESFPDYPTNNELLYSALHLYKKDLLATKELVKGKLGLEDITVSFPSTDKEIEFIDRGITVMSRMFEK